MRARCLPVTMGAWLWPAVAAAGLPVLTPDDDPGLLAIVAGMLAVWAYFRGTSEDP